MRFGRIWTMRGPSIWSRQPVIEAEVDLDESADRHAHLLTSKIPAAVLPFTNLPELLLNLTRFLQSATGFDGRLAEVHTTRKPGHVRLVFDYDEEPLVKACLDAAFAWVQSFQTAAAFPIDDTIAALRSLAHETRLGPSTRGIVAAALARGIPVRRLTSGSLVQLGWAKHLRRIWTAETDQTPIIAESIAQDKDLTRQLLYDAGVPVPWGRPVSDADDAWAAVQELGLPVVVKPRYGNQGRGVAANLVNEVQVRAAYAAARAESSFVMVESFVPGRDYRVLIVGGKLAAASLREPAHVIGDGVSSIEALIAVANKDPRRSDGHATPLSFIKIDAVALGVLGEQDLTPSSIPVAGQRVLIRRNANLSTGGTATDVTDSVHPENARAAIDAARVVGLDVAGVDFIIEDIAKPWNEQGGGIVEVNAGPGLRMHLEPSAGKPRDVGAAIVESLFPRSAIAPLSPSGRGVGGEGLAHAQSCNSVGHAKNKPRHGDDPSPPAPLPQGERGARGFPRSDGRIPIVAVTGVNGKTTTSRLIAHLLRTSGLSVGLTCTDGIYLNDRRTETRDCSGPHSARSIFLNPRIDAAVLETARGGILREGLGFDRCDVGVVTNIGQGDHFGLRGIETLDELARVKRVVVEAVSPRGAAVLNAADPLVAAMAAHCQGAVAFFARDEREPVLAAHRQNGGAGIFVRGRSIIFAEHKRETTILDIDDAPFLHGGVPFLVENALAAAVAALHLGCDLETIRDGLRTFHGDADECPARFNVFSCGASTVIVDYAHNPSAVAALVAGIDLLPNRRRVIVTSGSNRRDEDLHAMGEMLGGAFDRVVLYADVGHSGRIDGELNAMLKRGLTQSGRVREVIDASSERQAIADALAALGSDELLVIGVEAIDESLAMIRGHLQSRSEANL